VASSCSMLKKSGLGEAVARWIRAKGMNVRTFTGESRAYSTNRRTLTVHGVRGQRNRHPLNCAAKALRHLTEIGSRKFTRSFWGTPRA